MYELILFIVRIPCELTSEEINSFWMCIYCIWKSGILAYHIPAVITSIHRSPRKKNTTVLPKKGQLQNCIHSSTNLLHRPVGCQVPPVGRVPPFVKHCATSLFRPLVEDWVTCFITNMRLSKRYGRHCLVEWPSTMLCIIGVRDGRQGGKKRYTILEGGF
jgi:hypothetical protein